MRIPNPRILPIAILSVVLILLPLAYGGPPTILSLVCLVGLFALLQWALWIRFHRIPLRALEEEIASLSSEGGGARLGLSEGKGAIVHLRRAIGGWWSASEEQRAKDLGELSRRARHLEEENRRLEKRLEEGKRLEAELRAGREHLQQIINRGPAVIYTCLPDGDFPVTFVSENVLQFFGYSPAELMASSVWWNCIHPEDQPRVERCIGPLLEEGSASLEYRFRHREGAYRWVCDEARVVRNARGMPLEIVGALTDITERKSLEERLRHTEEHLSEVIGTLPVILSEMDSEGVFTVWEGRGCNRYSIPSEMVIGSCALDLFGDLPIIFSREAEKRTVSEIITAALKGEAVRVTFQYKNMFIDLQYIPVFRDDGSVAAVRGISYDISERVLAEQALRQAEERLHAIIKHSPVILFSLDGQGEFTLLEGRNLPSFGIDTQALLGQSALEEFKNESLILPCGGAITVPEAVKKALGGEAVRGVQHYASFVFEVHYQPIEESGGTVSGITGISIDITDKVRSENALRVSEERLQILFDYAPDAYILCDQDGRYLGGNRAAEALGGYSHQEILGKNILQMDMLREADLPIARAILSRSTQGIPAAPAEITIRRKDGREVDVELRTYPVHIQGEVQILGIARDVTERKRAESALRESEARYRQLYQEFTTLLDGIPDSLMLLSPKRQVIWYNRSTASLLKRRGESLVGRYCYELWCGSEATCQTCSSGHTLKTGKTSNSKVVTPDGRTWGVKTFPLLNSEGEIVSIIRWASDITERERLKEETLRNSQLASLGEMAAGMAHEINNPNGLVLLNLSLLQDAFTDALPLLEDLHREAGSFKLGGLPFDRAREEIPAALKEVKEGAQRIRGIVNDLKTFVRPDPLGNSEPTDLNAIVQNAVRMTASTLRQATDALEVRLGEGLPLFKGNSRQLEQVVINLLINASQALNRRSEAIRVATAVNDSGEKVFLRIEDEGCGIPPEHLSRVTDPFFTTRRQQGGTGLGLSVSARIVRDYRGTLHFDSLPAQGTTVTLSFPVDHKELSQ